MAGEGGGVVGTLDAGSETVDASGSMRPGAVVDSTVGIVVDRALGGWLGVLVGGVGFRMVCR